MPRSWAAFHWLRKKGNMERKRILELALETLENQRAEVDAAIAEISEMKGGIRRGIVKKSGTPTPVMAKRRSRTAAERKAQSLRMRRIWAEKKAARAKKPSPAGGKRKMRSAKSQAVSEGMRVYWAKKKAEAAKNETNAKTLS